MTGRTKAILLNGVYVGDFVVTGDDEKDLAAAQEVLKAKGLDKPQTVPQMMLMQAASFVTAARDLYLKYLMRSPYDGYAIAPFIVNSAFSIEIYLKTLLATEGAETKKIHGLLKLYDGLPEVIRHEIDAAAKVRADRYGVADPVPARAHLAQLNDAFERWRYVYEHDRLGIIYPQPTLLLMHALHDVCDPRVHKK